MISDSDEAMTIDDCRSIVDSEVMIIGGRWAGIDAARCERIDDAVRWTSNWRWSTAKKEVGQLARLMVMNMIVPC